jgi:hypothetical protein
VAGGVPVISGLQEGLAGDELFKIRGILNGTCNYILSQIEANGIPFATALREAQKLGFAEADPTEDIDGSTPAPNSPSWRESASTAMSPRKASWRARFPPSTPSTSNTRSSSAARFARFHGQN